MNQDQENIHLTEIAAALSSELLNYHELKESEKDIKKLVENSRQSIYDGVTKLGEPYADDYASAKIIEPKPSVRAKGKPINDLVTAWLKSKDPTMQSCGEMLQPHLTESTGKPYIKISKEKK